MVSGKTLSLTKSTLCGIPHCVPRSCFARRVTFFKMERVSIYIDGANFYGGLTTIDPKYTDTKFDFKKYLDKAIGKRILVQVYYYNASLKQQINPLIFKKQQKFFERLRHIEKYKVILCKRQQRISKDGESYFTIKGDDIHLAIDMLNDACENKYDTAILLSGDGDFAPLVKYVRNKGKKVENHHFTDNISLDLLKECNMSMVINKKIVNKFFYREEQVTIGDIISKK